MPVFSNEEQQQIRNAVAVAERQTSGQIRVCVEATCADEALVRATQYFHQLDMHLTKLRNGVLIYVAATDHKFAIIGDAGINEAVPDDFWDSTKEEMLNHFKQGDLVAGVVKGVEIAGEQLKRYFPHRAGGRNELPDDIAFMNGK